MIPPRWACNCREGSWHVFCSDAIMERRNNVSGTALGDDANDWQNVDAGLWTHLLITFMTTIRSKGLRKRTRNLSCLPTSRLDAATKRQLTICNLFANQNLSIGEIVKVLDSSSHQVVPALIEQGLIKERRRNRGKRGRHNERGGHSDSLSILPQQTSAGSSTAESEQRSNAAKVQRCQERHLPSF